MKILFGWCAILWTFEFGIKNSELIDFPAKHGFNQQGQVHQLKPKLLLAMFKEEIFVSHIQGVFLISFYRDHITYHITPDNSCASDACKASNATASDIWITKGKICWALTNYHIKSQDVTLITCAGTRKKRVRASRQNLEHITSVLLECKFASVWKTRLLDIYKNSAKRQVCVLKKLCQKYITIIQ